mgnify:CR=1 FL=1
MRCCKQHTKVCPARRSKPFALVLMLMDHIHYFFEFTGCIPEWFSMLARLSAPLFLFCTVEALPIRMTASGISSVSGASVRAWRRCNFS